MGRHRRVRRSRHGRRRRHAFIGGLFKNILGKIGGVAKNAIGSLVGGAMKEPAPARPTPAAGSDGLGDRLIGRLDDFMRGAGLGARRFYDNHLGNLKRHIGQGFDDARGVFRDQYGFRRGGKRRRVVRRRRRRSRR